jgi:hypothetical protein
MVGPAARKEPPTFWTQTSVRSKQLDLTRYDTDKIENRYLYWYDPVLEPFVDRDVKVLEMGVYKGGSILLWRDYFPKGIIAGVDLKLPAGLEGQDRIYTFQGSQADTSFLSWVANKIAPEGFDIIIDDASHFGALAKIAFWHLFEQHLKPSGLYVIEDWGTGYLDDWPDGKKFRPRSHWRALCLTVLQKLRPNFKLPWHNHGYGMVGFVKELVDEQGATSLTRELLTQPGKRESKFESMLITPAIVFITKRHA